MRLKVSVLMSTLKEKDNLCSYLSPKTRERAVKEIATGAGVLGELSATSALVSVSFETNGEIRTSHRTGSCRLEDQANSTSRPKSPLLVTAASHSLTDATVIITVLVSASFISFHLLTGLTIHEMCICI